MRFASLMLILSLAQPQIARAQDCPLLPVAEKDLSPPFSGHPVMMDAGGSALAFRSSLERDEDGMPNAYHRGNPDKGDVGRDDGVDHICAGADVLEVRWVTKNGKTHEELFNKYGKGGSIGNLDRESGHAKRCKTDYITLRDMRFPPCSDTQRLCMRWYGVKATPRSCGYDRPSSNCGIPIRQKDANGIETDYYLSTNALRRPGAKDGSEIQSDYADASVVPFIVIPDKVALPGSLHWRPGDYAVVVYEGAVAFAVVGDAGPTYGLGEASRALLGKFGRGSVGAKPGAFTLLFPSSARLDRLGWPLDPSLIESEGIARLQALFGGSPEAAIATLKRCAMPAPD